MSIKKLVIGLAVVAMALTMVSTASAQALTADQILAALTANPALLAQLSAMLGGGSSMNSSHTFSTDLTVGNKGDDVTALQHLLVDGGYLASGLPFGYFGPMTKAALIKWQIANGVSPAVGYFGPISRGIVNGMGGGSVGGGTTGGSMVPGCSAGAMYNSMTGALCSTGTGPLPAGCTSTSGFSPLTGVSCATAVGALPAGCTSATGYSITTGMSCAGGPGTSTGGTEGSITTKLAASPAANANVRMQTDVSVYGIEVSAVNSDMSVDRFDMQVAVTPVGGSAQNPGTFINTIKAWDGTTLLKSWSVANADFTKDSSDRYHIILTGLGFKVPKGTKKNLTFSYSVNSISSSDVNRTVAIQGYVGNTQNVRATDTVGLQSYSDMSGSANTLTHTFKPAGASTLTVSANTAATPKADNSKNSSSGVNKKMLQAFDAKSENGDSKITKVLVAANATSTMTAAGPTTLYLCASNPCEASPLGSASIPASSATSTIGIFSSLSILVLQDTTKTFYIAADYPSTVLGQMASSSVVANGVVWEKPDGSTASSTPSSALSSNDHYFDSAVPQWTFVSATPATVTTPTYSGAASSTISASLTFTVKALGGSLTKPVIADFGLGFASSTQTAYTDAQLLGVGESGFTAIIDSIDPSDATVGDGGVYTVRVKATQIAGTSAGVVIIPAAANYKLVATSTKAAVGGVTLTQTWNTATWESLSAFFTNN